ncbi:MAG: hypothetical protein HY543_05540, partial [Deltaproteobacteria bacterium]|nr:hypothetical protein [Deltaproteobacteria bacterium]
IAADPYLTARHADLLMSALLAHPERSVNRLYIAALLASVRDYRTGPLLPFLRGFQSIDRGAQSAFFDARLQILLGAAQRRIAAQALGKAYQALLRQVREAEAAGREPPAELAERYRRLLQYRLFFVRVAEARSAEEAAGARAELLAQLGRDFPLRVDVREEARALIEWLYPRFFERVRLPEPIGERFEATLREAKTAWVDSGILDRLVQFAGFAAPKGLQMARDLIDVYTDPAETDLVTIERPDLGGRAVAHLRYHGKFAAMRRSLEYGGLAHEVAGRVTQAWGRLWRFHAVADEQDAWVTLTHDLAEWARHGEEPRLTCSTWTTQLRDMHPTNWNYRFGPNPNADGRPLARPLIGQLALAGHRVKGKVVNRRLIELTLLHGATDAPRLRFLLERAQPEFELQVHAERQFREGIHALLAAVAAEAGLPFDIRVAEDEEAAGADPSARVLYAPYPFIRDFFRPA